MLLGLSLRVRRWKTRVIAGADGYIPETVAKDAVSPG